MALDFLEKIDQITLRTSSEWTEEEINFLKARRNYLNDKQIKDLDHLSIVEKVDYKKIDGRSKEARALKQKGGGNNAL